MSFARKLSRSWSKKSSTGTIRNWDPELPVAKIQDSSIQIRGSALLFPLCSFLTTSTHQGEVLRTEALLFRFEEEAPKVIGTCLLDFPVREENKTQLVGWLSGLGWDGRVWPREPGWPDEAADMEKAILKAAMKHKVAHVLVFPSGDLSSTAQSIEVKSPSGWFPLEPLAQMQDIDPFLVERFLALTEASFHQDPKPEDTKVCP